MTVEPPARFELKGRFAGFFRDVFGKRRMVLKVADDEVYLKVPKPLREEVAETLIAGQEVCVTGEHMLDDRGRDRRVVSQVRVAGETACFTCPIRICAKKNCWRNGGQDLWRELEHKIASAGLTGSVKLKAVGCMDHCKHGPNVEVGSREYHRCSLVSADEIMAQYTDHAA